MARDSANDVWYAGERYLKVYQLRDVDGDGDLLDETWTVIFTYPSYGGDHHDGMEFAAGYLWISDMTSDVIGQWYEDPSLGWIELQRYYYSDPGYVAGMGWGPNNHFWAGSGWGTYSYMYELGGNITGKYPVAIAGDGVPSHPPLIDVVFDGSGSYHQDPDRQIVQYEWDFDGDGVWDYVSVDPVTAHAFPADYNPDGTIDWSATAQDYVAILRVTDDTPVGSGGPLTYTDSKTVSITAPPWKPIADPGGPYNVRINSNLTLDGTGSYHPVELMYPPGHPWYDTIATWEWDLDNDGLFDDASSATVVTQWPISGTYFVGLLVTVATRTDPTSSSCWWGRSSAPACKSKGATASWFDPCSDELMDRRGSVPRTMPIVGGAALPRNGPFRETMDTLDRQCERFRVSGLHRWSRRENRPSFRPGASDRR